LQIEGRGLCQEGAHVLVDQRHGCLLHGGRIVAQVGTVGQCHGVGLPGNQGLLVEVVVAEVEVDIVLLLNRQAGRRQLEAVQMRR
jgi:hypothetical protein